MHTSEFRYLAVAAVAAMALAACSSSSKPASSTTPSTNAPTATSAGGGTAGATTVAVADSKYGKILVDSSGMTLYVDEKDKAGAPACTGACLTAWPPLTASGTPTAGTGVTGTLATAKASDGTTQVTIEGSPLYTWTSDKKAGDVTGQDVNGFYVVMANGKKYDPGASGGS
jgi:predicted lipoprotein with Yx(FWY)xxD motif